MNDVEFWMVRVQEITQKRECANRRFAQCVRDATLSLESELARLELREAALMLMRHDHVVLVRNSVGAPLSRYHDARRPCGLALGRGFSRMLEGEARQCGLRRCKHCPWPVALAEQVSA